MELDQLDAFLSAELAGQAFDYIPNPGNAGDSLIAAATYQLFARLGLTYRTPARRGYNASGRVLVYGGGGNLVGPATYSARLLARHHRDAARIIVLSHTIKDIDPLLDAFGDKVTLICRERVSFDYVRQSGTKAQALLAHDLAFGLDRARLAPLGGIGAAAGFAAGYAVKRVLGQRPPPQASAVLRLLRRAVSPRPPHVTADGTLYAFRRDGEAGGHAIPPGNIDLSAHFEFGVGPRPIADSAAAAVFTVLDRAEAIHTDRLHMAVAGALAGIKVHFYPNSYYKCRAVYEQSMKGRFDHVVWMGGKI